MPWSAGAGRSLGYESQQISHGEMVRVGPSSKEDYPRLPWRMGLLTQTNSPC